MTVGALALVAALAALALVPACSAHYQSDLGSLLRFGPSGPINDYYPQLSVTPARASWADLQARFPVKAARFSSSGSCESLAKATQEPFHRSQLLRNRPVLPWPAPGSPQGVPKALCRLGPDVTREQFDSLLSRAESQKAAKHLRHYRVLRGRLYVRGELSHRWNDPDLLEGYEELLLLAVYLYAIPDMEFWLNSADEPLSEGPMLQYAMDLRTNVSGCSMPYKDAWRDRALSLQQSMAWASCITHRHPPPNRRRRAVWRGTTTDVNRHEFDLPDTLKLARVRLHMLGLVHSDVLDVRISGITQLRQQQQLGALQALLETDGSSMGFEDFQAYAAVLDIDGNSFSSRMQQLVQMGGPMLKEASPFPSYFEHLFAPSAMPILHYATNLTDVAEQARVLLEAMGQEPRPNAWDAAVNNMHAVAAITLNRWSMVESVAYSLVELAKRNTWVPTDASGFNAIPWTRCCAGGGGLPRQLLDAMHAAEGTEGKLQAAVYTAADNASAAKVLAAFEAASSAVPSKGSGGSEEDWSSGAVVRSKISDCGSSNIGSSSINSSHKDTSIGDASTAGVTSSSGRDSTSTGASRPSRLHQHAVVAHSWLRDKTASFRTPSVAVVALIGLSLTTVVVWGLVAAGLLGRVGAKAAAMTAATAGAAGRLQSGRSANGLGAHRPKLLGTAAEQQQLLAVQADVELAPARVRTWAAQRAAEPNGH